MDVAVALHQIWLKKLWLVPVAIVAAIAATMVAYHVSIFPPQLESRSIEFGAADTELLVDSARSSLTDAAIPLDALGSRAQVYAELLRSEPVRQLIGDEAGIPWRELVVDGFASDGANVGLQGQPSATERAAELASQGNNDQLFFRVEPGQPIIQLTAQAPTAEGAERLVQGAAVALPAYIDSLQVERGVSGGSRVQLTQLGLPNGALVNRSADLVMASIAGVGVFFLGCMLILLVPRIVEGFRMAELEDLVAREAYQSYAVEAWERGTPTHGEGVPEHPGSENNGRASEHAGARSPSGG